MGSDAHRPLWARPLHARQPPAYLEASRGFEPLYDAYEELLTGLSPSEQDSIYRGTATAWFGLDRLGLELEAAFGA